MTLIEYFNKIKDEIKKENYIIININNVSIPSKISLHIESLNYMIFEWNEDHMDNRNDIFDYIIRPKDCDSDFTSITFTDFFQFLMSSKDTTNEMFEIKEKPIEIKEELDDFWLK